MLRVNTDLLISIDKCLFVLGELLTINETHELELFWALRGSGGGLFVIVTEFKLRLVKSPSLVTRFSFYLVFKCNKI